MSATSLYYRSTVAPLRALILSQIIVPTFYSALRSVLAFIGVTILLSGCVATPSTVTDYSDFGAYTVSTGQVTLYDEVQGRDVNMTVSFPVGAGEFPLVVFSHGAFCYPQQYSAVTNFWVSHGYVVVFPDHLDSPNGPKMSPASISKMLSGRSRDMSFVLDSLAEIAAALPEMQGQIDPTRATVAGHSFGGMIAMVKLGLHMESQLDGSSVEMADKRFSSAIIMSGVGQMEPMASLPQVPTMSVDAFSGLTKPLLASGGTLDLGNVGTGQIYPWQWRMAPYNLAPAGDKYSLVLQDSDHYLGGLICRSNRGGEDDPVAVAVVRAAQLAFLDAYVREDEAALQWLRTADFGALSEGRAALDYK
jgi:pimeloyl-ACP methyl ester carboxylesterase